MSEREKEIVERLGQFSSSEEAVLLVSVQEWYRSRRCYGQQSEIVDELARRIASLVGGGREKRG